MHIQDWLPTIYTAVGGKSKDLGPIDGIDMWDILNNDSETPRKQLLHNIDDIWKVWALRVGDYKMISGSTLDGRFDGWFLPPGESIQMNGTNFDENQLKYKNSKAYRVLKQLNYNLKSVEPILVICNSSVKSECKSKSIPCLFDIRSDPCEYNNIFDKRPEIVKSMLNILSKYNSTAVKPIVTEVDPKSNPVLHSYRWDVWQ